MPTSACRVRVKKQEDAYHLGRIRRRDWRPVGGDARGNEQEHPSSLSATDSEDTPSSEELPEDETDEEESQCADPTAWNPFKPRQWEEPLSEEEHEEGQPESPPTSQEPYPSVEDFEAPSTDQEKDHEDSRAPDKPTLDCDGLLWDGLFE